MLGCNRVGSDGNGLAYRGDSLIIEYLGQPLADVAPQLDTVLSASLDLAALAQYRQQFPAALDADDFRLV